MTFFARQDQARRQTGLLIFYLVVAVALITLALNLAVYWILYWTDFLSYDLARWFREPASLAVSGAVILTVVAGSLRRYLALRAGGHVVAEMMDARRLEFDSTDEHERRLINVVEEMSIASGTPVPALYIMDEEDGINAFVAGFKATEAVLVVTRGSLDTLDRDQLQGIVAHEYSHILNGDMRLNVRLMAILAGILMLGTTGKVILRAMFRGRRRSRSRGSLAVSSSGSKRRDGVGGQVGIALAATGFALVVVGYIGVFFARLIKAAVSRQREFLADASSVQFTRNPDGIAGALWAIKQRTAMSYLQHASAEATSHMCFGEAVRVSLSSWLATHPPIDERVRRIDAQFKAKMAARRIRRGQQRAAVDDETRKGARTSGAVGAMSFAGAAGGNERREILVGSGAEVVEQVGSPQPEHMDYAASLHAAFPAAVLTAAHVPELAVALVYGLIIAHLDDSKAAVGVALVKHQAGASTAEATLRIHGALHGLGEEFRLPVLELAIPSLKRLAPSKRAELSSICHKLVRVDRKTSVFEFVLLTLLDKHLDAKAARADRPRYFRYAAVTQDLAKLLSLLAHLGEGRPEVVQLSFDNAVAGFGRELSLLPRDACPPEAMAGSLARLAKLAPLLKAPVLEACVDCVVHDSKVTIGEAELLRAIAESLECPLPPLAAQAA